MNTEVAPAWSGFLPVPTPETAPFWDACNEGTFLLQRCRDCGKTQYHYRALCCHCWSDQVDDFASSGKGTVWTCSVVYKNNTPGYVDKLPYVVGLVELEGGVKVFGNILGDAPEAVDIGTAVEITFAKADNGQMIPLFEVAAN
ncbi:Zn-ribbon domain-containing OB-fold protein [Streptomyces sp. BH106]|uniref:Zn-ribbon domain-containing OB-fold protein n=1 Tax=Streptomyces sp. BH106 TaxID=3410409 RepID=UPI003CE70D50